MHHISNFTWWLRVLQAIAAAYVVRALYSIVFDEQEMQAPVLR